MSLGSETPKKGIGSARDDESVEGEGSVIALLKRHRTLLSSVIIPYADWTTLSHFAGKDAVLITTDPLFPPFMFVAGSVSIDNQPIAVRVQAKTLIAQVSGLLTGGAAGALVVDTGQIPNGAYDFDVTMGYADVAAAGKCLILEHRNAANSATLFSLAIVVAPGQVQVFFKNYPINNANERLRIINGAVAAGAAGRLHGTIMRMTTS